jgi:dCTP deaminase
MILSGLEIKKNLGSDIKIEPYDDSRLNPNSYNLCLHNELLVYDNNVLDMKKPNTASPLIIPEEGLLLETGKLYLGRTVEYTESHKFVPMLEGRSSIGRLGLFVHFCGFWTLEIFCVHPIRVYPGVEICQIFYHTIEGEYDIYKSGKYQHNKGIQPSLLYKDFEK